MNDTTTEQALVKNTSYWNNRREALTILREKILIPYFDTVEQLRVVTTRAIEVQEVVKHSYR